MPASPAAASCLRCPLPFRYSQEFSFDFTLALLSSGFSHWLVRNFSFDSRYIKSKLAMKRWKLPFTDSGAELTRHSFKMNEIQNIMYSRETLYNPTPAPSGWKSSGLWGWFYPLRFRQDWSEPLESEKLNTLWVFPGILEQDIFFQVTSRFWSLLASSQCSVLPSLTSGNCSPFLPPFLPLWSQICNTTPFLWFLKNATHPRQVWVGAICGRFWG